MNSSPWGAIQYQTVLAPGIVSCGTAGHGGFYIDQDHQRRLNWRDNWLKNPAWWEEDCDWSIPFYFFRKEIKANGFKDYNAWLQAAVKTIIHYHPEFATREGLGV